MIYENKKELVDNIKIWVHYFGANFENPYASNFLIRWITETPEDKSLLLSPEAFSPFIEHCLNIKSGCIFKSSENDDGFLKINFQCTNKMFSVICDYRFLYDPQMRNKDGDNFFAIHGIGITTPKTNFDNYMVIQQ